MFQTHRVVTNPGTAGRVAASVPHAVAGAPRISHRVSVNDRETKVKSLGPEFSRAQGSTRPEIREPDTAPAAAHAQNEPAHHAD
ncbi:hypothetical protein MRX96_034730 [Rhipicephalus microplus]